MNAPALRPRTVGEILDTAFQLYRSRFSAMVAATAGVVMPLLLLELIVPLDALGILERIGDLFFLAASAAVVAIAAGAYEGRDVDAVDAIRAMGRRFLSVWGAAIFQGILVGVGLLLLVVPGIIALAFTFAMQQAVMVEGCTTDEAWQRSKTLARGSMKPILLTSVLAFIIMMVAMIGVGTVMSFFEIGLRAELLLITGAMIVLNPLAAVVGTVLYYDLRIRKEAYDVVVAAERLPVAEPVPAF